MQEQNEWQEDQVRQLAFLIKLFEVGAQFLETMEGHLVYESEEKLATQWRNYIEADGRKVRREMYEQAVTVCQDSLGCCSFLCS